jgi:chromosome segregation ATPase
LQERDSKPEIDQEIKTTIESLKEELRSTISAQQSEVAALQKQLDERIKKMESAIKEASDWEKKTKEEVGNLNRELSANRDSVAAVSELEQLGELALAELEKLAGALETFQHWNENQSKTILLLERKIQEIMKQHEKVESHLCQRSCFATSHLVVLPSFCHRLRLIQLQTKRGPYRFFSPFHFPTKIISNHKG